ncbi:MAG: branched-chain amino acid transport system substrate-binding protein [Crocinitomicaceae bacterium]|jgi:branched-chain amino acid transport system substrate-binding protein
MKKKIGVLLPQSKEFPTMGKDFTKGLKLSLGSSEEVSYSIEGIGFGENSKRIIDAIQKLTQQDDVTLITGILGHRELSEVCDFVSQLEERLIFADLGATRPISLKDRSGVSCNSLEMFKSVYRLGKYFGENGVSSVGVSSCYNDAGYGFIDFLATSFGDGTAINFAGHNITPINPRENEAEILKEFVTETKPDAVFTTSNGVYALEHAEFLKESGANKLGSPFYGTPFAMDNKVLKAFPQVFDGTYCIGSWLLELQTQDNLDFVKAYEEAYNVPPSIFSVLGYENGLLIKQELDGGEAPVGPRGKLAIDPQTNRTSSNHYLWSITADGDAYTKTLVTELPEATEEMEVLSTDEDSLGWFNAYACH